VEPGGEDQLDVLNRTLMTQIERMNADLNFFFSRYLRVSA